MSDCTKKVRHFKTSDFITGWGKSVAVNHGYTQDMHSNPGLITMVICACGWIGPVFGRAGLGGPKSHWQSAGLRPCWPSKQRRGPSPSRQHHLWQEERLVDWPLMAPWPTGTWVGRLELLPWRPQAHGPKRRGDRREEEKNRWKDGKRTR